MFCLFVHLLYHKYFHLVPRIDERFISEHNSFGTMYEVHVDVGNVQISQCRQHRFLNQRRMMECLGVVQFTNEIQFVSVCFERKCKIRSAK